MPSTYRLMPVLASSPDNQLLQFVTQKDWIMSQSVKLPLAGDPSRGFLGVNAAEAEISDRGCRRQSREVHHGGHGYVQEKPSPKTLKLLALGRSIAPYSA